MLYFSHLLLLNQFPVRPVLSVEGNGGRVGDILEGGRGGVGGSDKTWVLMVHLQESLRIMHLSELNLFLFIP